MGFFSPTPRSITMMALLQIALIFGAILFAGITIGVYRKVNEIQDMQTVFRHLRPAYFLYAYGYLLLIIPVAIAAVLGFLINDNSDHEEAIGRMLVADVFALLIFLVLAFFSVGYFLTHSFWHYGPLGG